MPAKLLVAAEDLPGPADKGDIIEIYPDSYQWGNKEGLPRFIRVTISDKEPEAVKHYLERVQKVFYYQIGAQNQNGVRATVAVDPEFSGNLSPEVKQDLKDFILAGGAETAPIGEVTFPLSVSLQDQTPNSITVDIALPDTSDRLEALKEFKFQINEFGDELLSFRRFYFRNNAVDSVVSSGGEITIDSAEALNNVIDRLNP